MFWVARSFTLMLCWLAFTGCGRKASEPLRVAINPWPGYQLINLADHLGFFEANSVDVEIVDMLSNGEVNRAFERGYVDVAGSTLTDLVSIELRSDRSPVIFSVTDYSNGADVILSRSEFSDFSELKGKKIGADVSALDYIHLRAALDFYGMSPEDVVIVPMRQTDLVDAFDSDEVQAGVTYPPISDQILKKHSDTHKIFDTSMIPGTIIDVLVTDREFLKERRSQLIRFLRATDQAYQFYLQNEQESLKIMAEALAISVEEMAGQLSGIELLSAETQFELLSDKDSLNDKLGVAFQIFGESESLSSSYEHYDCGLLAELLK